jgi:hypothetical protein
MGDMEYTHLGRTGMSVSRVCLGTMNFGPRTDEADAHKIMDVAHERGVNFTAHRLSLRSLLDRPVSPNNFRS